MLPLPNLDDRTFEQLLREARDMIPGLFPEWTDENEHDPGITLLQMLAWHLEVQQYRLDRLTPNHERKFLKLLGDRPRDRQPSRSSVVFEGVDRFRFVPAGTVLRAGDVPFETDRELTLAPSAGARIAVSTPSGAWDVTDGGEAEYAPFYPFGPEGEVGGRMTIRFPEPLPAGAPFALWVELDEERSVPAPLRIPSRYAAFVPSAVVSWSYWDEAEGGAWLPLPLDVDDTYGFHQSGTIRFALPAPSRRLSASLVSGAYELVPRIRKLLWNEAAVTQGETHAVSERFDSAGEPGLVVRPRHALFADGFVQVQIRTEDGGWEDWEEVENWPDGAIRPAPAPRTFRLERTAEGVAVVFGDGASGAIPPAGEGRIRTIAVSPELYGRERIGAGTGISGQLAPLPLAPALPDRLELQVGWPGDDSERLVWRDWTRVDDFDRSSPDSRHYIFDDERGEVRFSDGTRGAVPPLSPVPNVRIVGLRVGGGSGGNIKEGQIRAADRLTVPGLRIANIRPAEGGAEPESTGEAIRRVRLAVLQPDCGVTSEDMERIVRSIPGLRVARVKAIPGFRPGFVDFPKERAFGHISVVVVPYGRGTTPRPGDSVVRTVRNHLEPYRLLGTKLHVVPPEYVTVTVRAVVVVDPRYESREPLVREALLRLLRPFGDGEGAGGGWEFGRPVYKADVYDAIHRVPGVVYIQDVWLTADGKDVFKEEGGDVRIPPHALVVSGPHEIECLSSDG